VVEAILILAFYHGKSALALAWGILPEPDLLGGTVKTSIPVAPFGSFAPSAAHSVSVAMEPSLDRLAMKGENAGSLGLPNTSHAKEDNDQNAEEISAMPETHRIIPSRAVRNTPLTPLDTASYLSDGTLDSQLPPGSASGTNKSQKRRKSFDEVGTSDGPFTLRPTISTSALSTSAPNFEPFLLYSAVAGGGGGGGNPLSVLKDNVLSPSSSASSILDTASFVERANNINFDGYSFTKFLDPSSEMMTFDQLDPNRNAAEWLPMEEFPWDNATCILGSYLESCVDLLDDYFKEAMEAEAESLAGSFSPIKPDVTSQPPGSGSPSTQGVGGQDRSVHEYCRDSGSEFEAAHRPNKSINEAAWYYSLRLVNIQKDDFRYSDITFALEKSTRRYLKLVCIQPAAVSPADWIGVQGSNTEEKCRMGLLVTQARFLGELLWGLKAVSDFL
jgi:hypothetical protein